MTIGRIPSVEGGIQPTIFDAKGDVLVASAADTPARLAVGNNGEQLLADSSATTGLRWQSVAQQNGIFNSAFTVAQRGTSFNPTSSSYGLDRWTQTRAVSGSTISRQATGDTTNLPNIQYCARIARDSGNTATNSIYFGQYLENIDSTKYVGQTVTVSFYARKGANQSGTLNFYLASGTGTDQNGVTGTWTGNTYVVNQSLSLTTTWARYSYSGSVASTKTQLGLFFDFGPSGTAGAADYFEVTGFQLEIGSVATAYRPMSATLAGELAACQRYYIQYGGSVIDEFYAWGESSSTSQILGRLYFPQKMRIIPTLTTSAVGTFKVARSGTDVTGITAVAVSGVTSPYVGGFNLTKTSGFTAGAMYAIMANNDLTSYLGWSAEL